MGPTGIVGRVAVVFNAVRSELALLASRFHAYPQIVVANERGKLLVRRDVEGRPAAAHRRPSRGGRSLVRLCALLRIHLSVAASFSGALPGWRLGVGLLFRTLNRLPRRLERATL